MRVLVVEDDPALSGLIAEGLRNLGYAVDLAADGREGLYMATEYPEDLAIIDLGLPEMSGLDVIRTMRESGKKYPVLILTARSQWQEKVEGLEAGADDYLTKPFHMEELKARINALLRRSAGHAQSEVTLGPVRVDLTAQRVRLEDEEVDLTSFEYKVLEYFILHPDQVVTKLQLSEHIYEDDSDRDSNVIEVFIGRLRKKLDPDGELKPIETLRGRGYRLNLDVD